METQTESQNFPYKHLNTRGSNYPVKPIKKIRFSKKFLNLAGFLPSVRAQFIVRGTN